MKICLGHHFSPLCPNKIVQRPQLHQDLLPLVATFHSSQITHPRQHSQLSALINHPQSHLHHSPHSSSNNKQLLPQNKHKLNHNHRILLPLSSRQYASRHLNSHHNKSLCLILVPSRRNHKSNRLQLRPQQTMMNGRSSLHCRIAGPLLTRYWSVRLV